MNSLPVSPRPTNRRGFTLVELLTVISVLSAAMVAGTRLMILLMNLNTAAAVELAHRDSVVRMETSLRRDIHQAQDITLPQADQRPVVLVILNSAGGEIRYTFDDKGVVRETLEAGIQRRELFLIPDCRFDLHRSGDLFRCTAAHDRDVVQDAQFQATERAARDVEIIAVVGLHTLPTTDPMNQEGR